MNNPKFFKDLGDQWWSNRPKGLGVAHNERNADRPTPRAMTDHRPRQRATMTAMPIGGHHKHPLTPTVDHAKALALRTKPATSIANSVRARRDR